MRLIHDIVSRISAVTISQNFLCLQLSEDAITYLVFFSTLESIIVKFDGWLCAFPKPLLGEKLLAFFHQFSHKGPICNSIYYHSSVLVMTIHAKNFERENMCKRHHVMQKTRPVGKVENTRGKGQVVMWWAWSALPPPLIKIGLDAISSY